jgi:hypothetical protein
MIKESIFSFLKGLWYGLIIVSVILALMVLYGRFA